MAVKNVAVKNMAEFLKTRRIFTAINIAGKVYSNARFARARARARMCARAVEYINMFKTLRTTIS